MRTENTLPKLPHACTFAWHPIPRRDTHASGHTNGHGGGGAAPCVARAIFFLLNRTRRVRGSRRPYRPSMMCDMHGVHKSERGIQALRPQRMHIPCPILISDSPLTESPAPLFPVRHRSLMSGMPSGDNNTQQERAVGHIGAA